MTYPPNAPVPPPAAPGPAPASKAPPTGWIAVVAGLCGLLALFLPWFTPNVKAAGRTTNADTSFHAWNGFFFLIIGPVLLIVFGVLWGQAVMGRTNSRFASSTNPTRSLSVQSIGAGVVSIVLALLAFPILTATYKFKQNGGPDLKWSSAEKLIKAGGGTLNKGPQFGLWLLIIGGVLLIVAGAIGMMAKSAAAAPGGYPPPQGGFPQQ